jgi:hemerythrin-like metal-binding protein
MAFVTWTDKHATGIESIDKEHKQLMELLNKLHNGMMTKKTNEILGGIFNELVNYTVTHFAHEEKLFKEHNYPNATTHIQEHKLLTQKALELQEGFNKKTVSVSIGTMNFLKDWLDNHIMKTDMVYKDFLKGKGAK